MPKQVGNLTLYDLEELSSLLNITVISLREYIKKGKIRGQKLGKRYFITQEALNEYFSQHQ